MTFQEKKISFHCSSISVMKCLLSRFFKKSERKKSNVFVLPVQYLVVSRNFFGAHSMYDHGKNLKIKR